MPSSLFDITEPEKNEIFELLKKNKFNLGLTKTIGNNNRIKEYEEYALVEKIQRYLKLYEKSHPSKTITKESFLKELKKMESRDFNHNVDFLLTMFYRDKISRPLIQRNKTLLVNGITNLPVELNFLNIDIILPDMEYLDLIRHIRETIILPEEIHKNDLNGKFIIDVQKQHLITEFTGWEFRLEKHKKQHTSETEKRKAVNKQLDRIKEKQKKQMGNSFRNSFLRPRPQKKYRLENCKFFDYIKNPYIQYITFSTGLIQENNNNKEKEIKKDFQYYFQRYQRQLFSFKKAKETFTIEGNFTNNPVHTRTCFIKGEPRIMLCWNMIPYFVFEYLHKTNKIPTSKIISWIIDPKKIFIEDYIWPEFFFNQEMWKKNIY